MIDGLDSILSQELRKNLIGIQKNIYSYYSSNPSDTEETRHKIDRMLTNYVWGIEVPISISDGWARHMANGGFEIILTMDYRVFSGYEPYQDEDLVKVSFKIDKTVLREHKIEQICG